MTGSGWLSMDEQRAWRAYLDASRLILDALDRQLQRDSGMPHAYYEILVRLSEAPNRSLRMSELADVTRSSRSRLSHAAARLEQSGWVVREECPTDRRGAIARLTDAGFAALAAAAAGHVAEVRRAVLEPLSEEEFAELGRLSAALVRHLSVQGDLQQAVTKAGDKVARPNRAGRSQ